MVVVGPPDCDGSSTIPPTRSMTMSELMKRPLIMPPLPHNNRRLLDEAAAQQGIRIAYAVEVDSISMTRTLVGRGLGYSVLTCGSVQHDIIQGRLRVYRLDQPRLQSALALVTRRESRSSWLVADFSATLKGLLQALFARGDWKGARLAAARKRSAP
jgi:LysR family nitrogen assimilation transcriptional regulator